MTDVYENVVAELSRDDLTKIKGIGSTTAEKLYNAKIVSVRQIAEMTPDRLSETPGIGLATATKFITAAKNFLEESQNEDFVIDPVSVQIREELIVKSPSPSIERYEVEEVIVEEVKDVEEIEEFKDSSRIKDEIGETIESSQTQEKWFSDKFNYSRLTASYTPISARAQAVRETIESEEQKSEEISYLKDPTQDEEEKKGIFVETAPTIPILRDQPKVETSISRTKSFDGITRHQISSIFKDVGYYEIPNTMATLKRFTNSLDYLGCKIVQASNDLNILLLFPLKCFNQEGTVLVDETKLELKSYAKINHRESYRSISQTSKKLLQTRDSMNDDIESGNHVLNFFQKYLQLSLSLEKGFGKNSVVFLSGTTQYKIYIEPILLCSSPPRSMEKPLVFPYQKSTNLHVVSKNDLIPLTRFLEKKYQIIENRTKKSSSINDYKGAEETFRSSVKFASIPIFGYSVTLLIIYFAELYFLLRLLNTIGLAVIGIYLSLLSFFYFRAYKTKKQFTDQFETPYYQQNLEFNETDLLNFREELTDELLTQFGYECLERDAKFGVIEQSETNALKLTVETKKNKAEFKKMFEPEQVEATTVSIPTTKYKTKYQDFLEDP